MSSVVGQVALRIVCILFLVLEVSTLYSGEKDWLAERKPCVSSSAVSRGQFLIMQERHNFSGLASYYDDVDFYIVGKSVFQSLDSPETVELTKGTWLAVSGRFDVLLVDSPGRGVQLSEWDGTLDGFLAQVELYQVRIVRKCDLYAMAPELDQLRYAHLWAPLSWLAKVVEYTLTLIFAYTANSWGLTIVLLSILLKVVLTPVHIAVACMQDKVGRIRSVLAPRIEEIRANYDGEEAHNRIMAAHGALGITPFYSLKPLLGVLVQIPIWIAVFNALGEMPHLAGQSFLWIDDLAYPDAIAEMPFSVPLFGATVHLLPLVMTGIACLSAWTFRNDQWSKVEGARQRRSLYGMAILFLFLFYPFPSAMVLYWTLNNLLSFVARLGISASRVLFRT